MRNVSYVGLCWAMTLGLVAVALGQQQVRPRQTWQNHTAVAAAAGDRYDGHAGQEGLQADGK